MLEWSISFSLFNATQILSIGWVYHDWKSIFPEIFDLSLECPEACTFSDFFERIAQIGTQASTGAFCCGEYTWVRKS